ncbi:MAG: DNA repair protein RadC [Roseburia sp.]
MNQYLTMKELPESEQPYEKVLRNGAEVLSDAELLAVIIRAGTKNVRSIEVAQNILRGKNKNLLNLFDLSIEELKEIPGIGKVKAIQLKCIAELAARITKSKRYEHLCMTNAKSVAAYYMEQMRHQKQERLIIAMFDSKCQLIGDALISIGSVNSAFVPTREIFLKALEHRAVYFILLHNHPSGSANPSSEDIYATKQVVEAGELLGIEVADHIIIGDNQYYSFKEKGLLT